MQLGRNIVYYRTRLGLTRSELSRRMGVTPQAAFKWEHDLNCPDIALLPNLAALLGVSVDTLLSDKRPEG